MSYSAKVYKVFIASPSDVQEERDVIRNVLAKWNAINSERLHVVLLPVGWETHAAPEAERVAQDYINEELLDKCDMLIGVFWTRVGTRTKNFDGGSIEEVYRNIGSRKLTMLYFSKKSIPSNADLNQLKNVRKLKETIKDSSFYYEYNDITDFELRLYDHLQIKIAEGRFRPRWDSDIISQIEDDASMAEEIRTHYPLVAKNVLRNIVDQDHDAIVWSSIIEKLRKEPADLRDSMIFLAQKGAFKHPAYMMGAIALASESQPNFGNFMSELYSINKYEFWALYDANLLEDSELTQRLLGYIQRSNPDDLNNKRRKKMGNQDKNTGPSDPT